MNVNDGQPITLPAGKYWIGDPCYVLAVDNHELWCELLEQSDFFNKPCEYLGRLIYAFSTEYGDGEYEDQYGNQYGVDAGMIGIVPVEVLKDADKYGTIHEFDKPFYIWRERNGELCFGHIVIPTGFEADEEEDEESEW